MESGSSRLRVHYGTPLRCALIANALTLHIPRATSLYKVVKYRIKLFFRHLSDILCQCLHYQKLQ